MSGAPSSGPGAGHVGGLCLLGLVPSLTLFRRPEATFPQYLQNGSSVPAA